MDNKSSRRFLGGISALLMIGATAGTANAGGLLSIPFDLNDFTGTNPQVIDNEYWPLKPGGVTNQTFVYEVETEDGCVLNHIIVTTATKTLTGAMPYTSFEALEVEDIEWLDEECDGVTDVDITERTLDWYRQDMHGNIWYLGEDTESFGDGCPVFPGPVPPECKEGAWEAGQFGPDMELVAEAGIVVPSDNPTGDMRLSAGTFYMQELAEGAEDMAKVLRRNARVSLQNGDFASEEYLNCRETKEWTALDPGSVEHKLYCPQPGQGLMLIKELSGGPTALVELTEVIVP